MNCWYCGAEIFEWPKTTTHGVDLRRFVVREHQVPRSRGGKLTVKACFSCNSRKGTKDVVEYRIFLKSKNATAKACISLIDLLASGELDGQATTKVFQLWLELQATIPEIVFHGEGLEPSLPSAQRSNEGLGESSAVAVPEKSCSE